jgi:cell division protein FtsQ
MKEKPTVSRSEEVRQRRGQQQVRRQKQTKERAYRPLPPVTARGKPALGTRQPARKPAARRYNAAMALVPDRVLLPRLQTGPRLVSLVLVLLLAGALYYLLSSPQFRVGEVQVNGLSRLTAAELNSTLGLSGRMVFLLQPQQVASDVRVSFPELSSAQVEILFPNQVVLTVTERQPVLFWQQGDGYTWVDENGVAFRPHGEAPGLITVLASTTPPGAAAPASDPLSPPSYVAPDLVRTAQLLAASLPPGSTLTYDGTHGFGWVDGRGWQVYFGTASKDVALKLRIYQSMVDSLTARGIFPAFISVVHADAPYYRMDKQ